MRRPRWRASLATAILISITLLPLGAAAGELLYSTEGNRLRRFDVESMDGPRLVGDVLVQNASASESGGAFPEGNFRDMNGMICPFSDGSGRFVNGEDSGQPNPPPGWGVFEADGTQVGKLTATYNVSGAEPFGCAFNANGILFTTEVGNQGFGTPNGQLIMWFPPYDQFPGPAGAYPNTNATSTSFCKLATDLGTAGGVAIDSQGRVYAAASSQLSIFRFSPPFPTSPDAAGGCGSTDALGSPMADVVNRETFVAPAGLSTFSGLAFAPNGNLYAAKVFVGEIAEYDLSGNLVRMILDPPEALPPIATGTPQGLAVDSSGTLYYADLDLVGTLPNVGPGPNGKVRRIRFDAANNPLPPEVVRQNLAFPDGVALFPGELEPENWKTYAGGKSRRFFNPRESAIGSDNASALTIKWTFPTNAIITASPTVAQVAVPGEGRIKIAYIQSWDANVYAVRIRDGSELWRFETADRDGVSFPNTASVHFATVGGEDRIYVGSGQTFYCLDAVTGAELWRFDVGTGCVVAGACSFTGERNEIESSAFVADGKVFFGMDVNDRVGGKGGFFALDATDGRLVWFFDLESGQTCRSDAGDDIRRYDGYHSEEDLGLPSGFFTTRAGCDHPRSLNGCGNVWSSPAYDDLRDYLYFASSNCDTDTNPGTLQPDPPMPPYDEALVALDLDGNPVWHWRPREVDNADLAFGAVPNLFTAVIGGREREVVGIGNKDGTYYLLDRDGVNEITAVRWDGVDKLNLPYWTTNVVPGGSAGGIVATPAVDDAADRIYFGTAPGSFSSVFNPQRPTMHAVDAGSGAILWQNTGELNADATFAPTSAIPEVVFTGSILSGNLRFYDADDGTKLGNVNIGAGVAAAPAVVDGLVLVGGGIGTRTGNPADPSEITSRIPQNLTALCVPGTPACAVDLPVSGRRLRVIDSVGDPGQRRFVVASRHPSIAAPPAGSPSDPTQAGLVLRLLNPGTGEEQGIDLPASNWKARGTPPGARGYRYRDRRLQQGPCKDAVLRDGRLYAKCVGSGISFTLDESQQNTLAVGVELGNEVYCARFGGKVRRDVGTAQGARAVFAAVDSPAPIACPLP